MWHIFTGLLTWNSTLGLDRKFHWTVQKSYFKALYEHEHDKVKDNLSSNDPERDNLLKGLDLKAYANE